MTDWKDEYENLCKFASDLQAKLAAAEEALTAVQLSHATLVEALEFYADSINYQPSGQGEHWLPVEVDGGAKARAALKIEETP